MGWVRRVGHPGRGLWGGQHLTDHTPQRSGLIRRAVLLAAGAGAASFLTMLSDFAAGAPKDPKTALQEWAAARGMATPRYEVVSQEGPPHEPHFTVAVRLGSGDPETGKGGSKRAAEH